MELLRPLSWKLHVLIWSDKIRTMHKFESIGFRCSWADRKRLGIRQGNEPATLSYPPYCHLILMKSVWFPYTYLSHAQRLSKNSRPSPRLTNQKTDALDVYSRQRKRNNLLFFFYHRTCIDWSIRMTKSLFKFIENVECGCANPIEFSCAEMSTEYFPYEIISFWQFLSVQRFYSTKIKCWLVHIERD